MLDNIYLSYSCRLFFFNFHCDLAWLSGSFRIDQKRAGKSLLLISLMLNLCTLYLFNAWEAEAFRGIRARMNTNFTNIAPVKLKILYQRHQVYIFFFFYQTIFSFEKILLSIRPSFIYLLCPSFIHLCLPHMSLVNFKKIVTAYSNYMQQKAKFTNTVNNFFLLLRLSFLLSISGFLPHSPANFCRNLIRIRPKRRYTDPPHPCFKLHASTALLMFLTAAWGTKFRQGKK